MTPPPKMYYGDFGRKKFRDVNNPWNKAEAHRKYFPSEHLSFYGKITANGGKCLLLKYP